MQERVCSYCGEFVEGVEMLDHAMYCEEMHESAKEVLPEVMGGSVFTYIDMPCGDMVERSGFTEHMGECIQCAEIFTAMMYGERPNRWEM